MSGVTCASPSSSTTLVVSWSPSTSSVLSYQLEVRRYAVDQEESIVTLTSLFDQEYTDTGATINGLGKFSSDIQVCVLDACIYTCSIEVYVCEHMQSRCVYCICLCKYMRKVVCSPI